MTRKSPLKGFIHDLFLGKSQGTFTYYSINNMHNILKNQFNTFQIYFCASQVLLVVKSLPVDAGDIREAGLIPGSGRSPGGGHGNPLQDSCLENPVERGAWQATILGVSKSQTRLKWLSTHKFIFWVSCLSSFCGWPLLKSWGISVVLWKTESWLL